jgi:hypothetical protein
VGAGRADLPADRVRARRELVVQSRPDAIALRVGGFDQVVVRTREVVVEHLDRTGRDFDRLTEGQGDLVRNGRQHITGRRVAALELGVRGREHQREHAEECDQVRPGNTGPGEPHEAPC